MNRPFEPLHAVFSGVDSAHTFFITSKGGVFAIGMNTHGQLGLGDQNNRQTATRVSFFNDITLEQIACGGGHTLFLSKTSSVYSCGKNIKGQLGLGDMQGYSIPRKISFFSNKKIVKIACGSRSSYCLDASGKLYKFGYVYTGGGFDTQFIPTLVQFKKDAKIVSVSCGYNHVATLSMDGHVYTFGYSETGYHYGQLGRGGDWLEPGLVELPNYEKAQQVVCGGNFTNIIVSDTIVYSFGYNKEGELGVGDSNNRATITKVEFFERNPLKCMLCGGGHTLCILKDHSVVGHGYNGYNQLNVPSTPAVRSPAMVRPLEGNERIYGISCGRYTSFFVTKKGVCFGCGIKGGFSSISNLDVPRVVFSNVLLNRDINVEYATDFFSLIMDEQVPGEEEEVTADLELRIAGGGEETIMRLHSVLVNERSPQLLELLHEQGEERVLSLEMPCAFTGTMVEAFLNYYYSERIDFTKLAINEIALLRRFSSKYKVSDLFEIECEKEIRERLEAGDSAINLYFEAVDLADEDLMRICLECIWRDYRRYQKQMVELGMEKMYYLNSSIKVFTESLASSPGEAESAAISKSEKEEERETPDFLECMKILHRTKETTGDFLIKSDFNDKVTVHHAHKFVLVARSDYFKSMIKGGYQEAKRSELVCEMTLGKGFELYLEYLYTGELRTDSKDCLLMLPCIQYFGISWESVRSMKIYCERIVNSIQLNKGNCLDMLKMSDEMGISELSDLALEYIVDNYIDIEENIDSLDLHLQVLVTRRVLKRLMENV